jgi:hypothetical protein
LFSAEWFQAGDMPLIDALDAGSRYRCAATRLQPTKKTPQAPSHDNSERAELRVTSLSVSSLSISADVPLHNSLDEIASMIGVHYASSSRNRWSSVGIRLSAPPSSACRELNSFVQTQARLSNANGQIQKETPSRHHIDDSGVQLDTLFLIPCDDATLCQFQLGHGLP